MGPAYYGIFQVLCIPMVTTNLVDLSSEDFSDLPEPTRTYTNEVILLDSENIDTIVEKIESSNFSLKIADETFDGYINRTGAFISGLSLPLLNELSKITYIQGSLIVTASHNSFTSLSFLKNLKAIGGGLGFFGEKLSLVIANSSLSYLGLTSLWTVQNGILIKGNKKLCANSSKRFWQRLMPNCRNCTEAIKVEDNKPEEECGSCDLECDQDFGCWGPGPGHCRKCRNFFEVRREVCVERCDSDSQYATKDQCHECFEECIGCKGPYEYECLSCKNYAFKDYCMLECNEVMYSVGKTCMMCADECFPRGCSGPGKHEGKEGCNPCPKPNIFYGPSDDIESGPIDGFHIQSCLESNDTCPEDSFERKMPLDAEGEFGKLAGKTVCVACHRLCLKCTDYGFNREICHECEEHLFPNCSCFRGSFFDIGKDGCRPCSSGCLGCTDLSKCEEGCEDDYFRVYDTGFPSQNGSYSCSKDCPSTQPFIYHGNQYQNYCSSLNDTMVFDGTEDEILWYIYPILTVIVFSMLVACNVKTWRQSKHQETQLKINKILEDFEEPLVPTNIAPNRSRLRIIKKTDVKTVEILGSGAFGTVYRGFCVLDESKARVPVAIKVVNPENRLTSTKDFLEEASIMACVNHPNLLRLLAICLTSDVMLVTQLMPLGDLLHYLRGNRENIMPKTLLSWCVQIAKGMSYLEEHRLVHRDLAARNVLLQTVNRVKVTDFGLTRALDVGQEIYASRGGKLPVKWLALESLKRGIFTSKTDVWSFGVTVWEILTFGREPFRAVESMAELISCLQNGVRLLQPECCTVNMYSTLATCWAEDSEARPSFQNLAETFMKMANDPTRFIIVSKEYAKSTAPELPPRNRYSEIDEDDQSQTPTSEFHEYVNVSKKTASYSNLLHPSNVDLGLESFDSE